MKTLEERLTDSWQAIHEIKDNSDFDELYLAIEDDVLQGLHGDERNAAIEALNAYLAQIGKADTIGFV